MACLGTVALFEYLRETLILAWLWAGLCLPASVFFLFRARLGW
jgi:uncharacterized protein (DUF486 family)